MDKLWRALIATTVQEKRDAKAAAAKVGEDIQDWLADAVREKLAGGKNGH